MKSTSRFACCLVAFGFGGSSFALAAKPKPEDVQAARHVQAALRAELKGDNAARKAALDRAIAAAPDYAPARWGRGEIQIKQGWTTVVQLIQTAGQDSRLRRYHVERLARTQSVEDQYTLGVWCLAQGLIDEGRVHLLKVLEKEPTHRSALHHLGLRWVDGELLTQKEIEAENEAKRQVEINWKKWTRKLQPLRRDYEFGEAQEKADALKQIRAIDDPAAIPAMEAQLSSKNDGLALEVIAILERMPDQDAVRSLLRHAVDAREPKVRSAAIDVLKKRPFYDYGPQLIAALSTPISGGTHVSPRMAGATLTFKLYRENQGARFQVTRGYSVDRVFFRLGSQLHEKRVSPVESHGAAAKSRQIHATVRNWNAGIRRRNERIGYVLGSVTDQEFSADPAHWWSWWSDLNELEEYEKPLYSDVAYYVRTDTTLLPSCFPSGTPVWTLRGRVPIEHVRAGDRVLAQDQDSGEIAFQPVLERTTRDQTPLLKIKLENETIRCTKGHPFWVNGKGWRMAKRLKPDDVLHGLHGALPIIAVESDDPQVAYNLIVEKFHNYFVGDTAVLVHDNVIREPTSALVPGLTQDAVAAGQ